MRHGGPLGRGVSHGCSDIGGDGGTDIFTEDHGCREFERNDSRSDEQHDYGHRGSGRLETDGHHSTYEQEQEH